MVIICTFVFNKCIIKLIYKFNKLYSSLKPKYPSFTQVVYKDFSCKTFPSLFPLIFLILLSNVQKS